MYLTSLFSDFVALLPGILFIVLVQLMQCFVEWLIGKLESQSEKIVDLEEWVLELEGGLDEVRRFQVSYARGREGAGSQRRQEKRRGKKRGKELREHNEGLTMNVRTAIIIEWLRMEFRVREDLRQIKNQPLVNPSLSTPSAEESQHGRQNEPDETQESERPAENEVQELSSQPLEHDCQEGEEEQRLVGRTSEEEDVARENSTAETREASRGFVRTLVGRDGHRIRVCLPKVREADVEETS